MRVRRIPPLRSRPSVSVVVPCYRYGHYLDACVASILAQDGVDVDVLIVDDASPDGSADVANRLAAEHPQVTSIVHERNLGHIATYNDGLARVTGDYAVLLSADDLLAPGALARATAIMQKYPRVGLVYGFAPDFDGVPVAHSGLLRHCHVWRGQRWLDYVSRSGQNPVSTPAAVMRRDVLVTIGGYDSSLPHTADLLMWLRAAACADVGYVSGVDQAFYRVHGANMHSTDFDGLNTDKDERRTAFRTFAGELAAHQGRHYLARAAAAIDAQAPPARVEKPLALATQRLRGRLDWQLWRLTGLRL